MSKTKTKLFMNVMFVVSDTQIINCLINTLCGENFTMTMNIVSKKGEEE